ncbi:NAD(P)H-binding protein [Streptomyces sp. NPDC001255]|uniref:NAD(P)H-binding protein n=1 Tax=Streptomyces sp. NPDC001255 TaxID=3364550 RepID=UPI0036BC42F8
MILITGATGNVGNFLTRLLHERGCELRILVRDPARSTDLPDSIERAVGNLDNADDVAKAVEGVDAIFLMHHGAGTQQTQNVINAARKAAKPPHIVLLSSAGARLMPLSDNPLIGQALADREELLNESGLPVTFLRPNAFASNVLPWVEDIRTGKVVNPTGDGRMVFITPEDIARCAAVCLTEEGHAGKGYDITGPEALTTAEAAAVISEITGQAIEVENISPAEYARRQIAEGVPEAMADGLASLNRVFELGRSAYVTDGVKNLTGRAPETFRHWCEVHADSLR